MKSTTKRGLGTKKTAKNTKRKIQSKGGQSSTAAKKTMSDFDTMGDKTMHTTGSKKMMDDEMSKGGQSSTMGTSDTLMDEDI